MTSAAQRVGFFVALAWAVLSLCVSISFLWTARGTVGLTAAYSGRVTAVAAGSPAQAAGIVAGDRIALAQTPFESRPKLAGAVTPVAPGTAIPFTLLHGSHLRSITLTAVPLEQTPIEHVSYIIMLAATAIFAVVGAALIWLRPSRVTWGFGLYCLFTNPVVPALARFPSAGAHLIEVAFYDVVQNIGFVGLLVFALNFPHTLNVRWRTNLVRLLPWIFITLSLWTLSIDIGMCAFALPMDTANSFLQAMFGLIDLVTIYLVTETYVRGPATNRPRVRWVLVGFYVGLVASFIGNTLVYTANVALPAWTDSLLIATTVVLPLAVSYAVVRHRVIEVDVFLSHALIYATFTTSVIVIFGLIDYVFGQLLENFRLSVVLDALITVGIALVFDRLQKHFERFAETIVFRSRGIANERLERTARTFKFVTMPRDLDTLLVTESAEALKIVSVALFRRGNEDSACRLVAAHGWPSSHVTLAPNDRLLLEHAAREGPLAPAEIPWTNPALPSGPAAPVLSIPLLISGEVRGAMLLSRKRNGEDLDPEEVQRLSDFAGRATVAYDRLEAEELQRTASDLRAQVDALTALLENARRAT